MSLPEPNHRFAEGICETQIPPQNTAPLAGSSTPSTQIARTDLAAVVPDARVIDGRVVLYSDLCREPETARWIARCRRIRGRS